jgi:hypothetical protein
MAFLDEIMIRLVAAGVGVKGANLFLGSNAIIPKGDGPYLTVSETGGTAPTRIHNQTRANTQRPTAQIAVRAALYPPARTMAQAAYDALDGVFNTTIGPTFYQKITTRQEPTDIGLDSVGRPTVVFNIEVEKEPSV